MNSASTRSWRNPSIALALTALGVGFVQSDAGATVVRAAAAPKVSNVAIAPTKPSQGEGFKVSFKTAAGGSYVVFYSTGQSGGALVEGKTKDGTIKTRRIGKDLRHGKYTIGVRVTVGKKSKDATKTLTIKKR
jgi:hypothetical protein